MHKLLIKLTIATFLIFYFLTHTGLNLAGAGLATANHIAPIHLLIHFKRLQSLS
jgi:hypothetical protein